MSYTGSKAVIGRGCVFSIGLAQGTAAPTGVTATTATGSAGLTAVSAPGAAVGMGVSGAGIPAGATVIAVGTGTITLSANATATATLVALTFTVGYTPIGEIIDTGISGRTYDKIEVSNFDSQLDKEYIKGLRDPGAGDITYNRVPTDTGQISLEAAFQAAPAYMFKFQFIPGVGQTTGEVWTFAALVMSVDPPTIAPNKQIQGKCMLQVTGPRTITLGT